MRLVQAGCLVTVLAMALFYGPDVSSRVWPVRAYRSRMFGRLGGYATDDDTDLNRMNNVFKLLPEQASTVAGQIDALYVFLVAISVFFTILTAVLVVLFAVKYRRRSDADVPEQPHEDSTLEIVCGSALLVLVLVIFGWGAKIFFDNNKPARRRHGNPGGGQAVDVETATPQRQARDQHPARAGGAARQTHHDVGGCHPQLLHPRLPGEAGCGAGPLYQAYGSKPPNRAPTICSAPSIAAPSIRAWADGGMPWPR
jgi:amino acid transporter